MMPSMPKDTSFSIKAGEEVVHAAIHVPPEAPAGAGKQPAVLLCCGLNCDVNEEFAEALQSQLVQSLLGVGLAVVTWQAHCADKLLKDFHDYSAEDDFADAHTVLGDLGRYETLDTSRLGVIGLGMGALTAAKLSVQVSGVQQLCLLCPALPHEVAATSGERNSQHLVNPSLLPDQYRASIDDGNSPALDGAFFGKLLTLAAAADRDFTIDHAEWYANALGEKARSAEYAIIPLATHQMSEPEQREFTCELVARFFAPLVQAA
jgi:hypothetical protein